MVGGVLRDPAAGQTGHGRVARGRLSGLHVVVVTHTQAAADGLMLVMMELAEVIQTNV